MGKDVKRKMSSIINKNLRGVGILFVIFGLLLVLVNIEGVFYAFSDKKDILEVIDNSNPTGEAVTVDINAIYGNYATLENKTNGITTSKQYYYLALLDNEKFIGIKVSSKNRDIIEDICTETYKYMYGETYSLPGKVQFKGIVKSAESDAINFLRDYLISNGYSDGEIDSACYSYYYIDTTCVSNFRYIVILVGVVLFIIGVFFFFGYKLFAQINKQYNRIQKSGVEKGIIDTEILNGDCFRHIIIGDDLVFIGKHAIVIEKGGDLAWIYGKITKNRSVKTYSMVLYTIEGRKHEFNCTSEREFDLIISSLRQKYSHMMFGINSDLDNLVKNKTKFREYFMNRKSANNVERSNLI